MKNILKALCLSLFVSSYAYSAAMNRDDAFRTPPSTPRTIANNANNIFNSDYDELNQLVSARNSATTGSPEQQNLTDGCVLLAAILKQSAISQKEKYAIGKMLGRIRN